MKRYFLILIGILFLFSACEEKQINAFSGSSYVSFVPSDIDTTSFSFFFQKEDIVQYPLYVQLMGDPGPARTFKLAANLEATTLNSSLYEIPEEFTFKEGAILDTIYITLKNDPDLLINQYLLVVELQDGGDLMSAKGAGARSIMTVTDRAVRPDWWDDRFERDYLGKYSRKKFELFIQVTGEGDLGGKTATDKRRLSLKFKHYLESHDPIWDEENEEDMTVTVIG